MLGIVGYVHQFKITGDVGPVEGDVAVELRLHFAPVTPYPKIKRVGIALVTNNRRGGNREKDDLADGSRRGVFKQIVHTGGVGQQERLVLEDNFGLFGKFNLTGG